MTRTTMDKEPDRGGTAPSLASSLGPASHSSLSDSLAFSQTRHGSSDYVVLGGVKLPGRHSILR